MYLCSGMEVCESSLVGSGWAVVRTGEQRSGAGDEPGKEGRAEGFLTNQQLSLAWTHTMWTQSQTCPALIRSVTSGELGPEPDQPRIAAGSIP